MHLSWAFATINACLFLTAVTTRPALAKLQLLQPKQFHAMIVKMHVSNENLLMNIGHTSTCEPALFIAAKFLLSVEQDKVLQEVDGGYVWALGDGQRVAVELNELADIEAEDGCRDLAKQTYLQVIDNFTGLGYEAMRQHATIRIDDLRSN